MYGVIKNVINAKRYELADMLKKLDTLWVQGSITEEQRNELISLAQNNAKAENSIDILIKLADLDRRITALEKANESAEEESAGGDASSEEETEEVVTYPKFEVGKWYYAGDKVSFNGSNYVCIAPADSVCVWNPIDYPAYWEKLI